MTGMDWFRLIAPFVTVVLTAALVILYTKSWRDLRRRTANLADWHERAMTSLASMEQSQRSLDELLEALYDDPRVKARIDERRARDAAIIESQLNAAGFPVTVDPADKAIVTDGATITTEAEAPDPRTPGDDRV